MFIWTSSEKSNERHTTRLQQQGLGYLQKLWLPRIAGKQVDELVLVLDVQVVEDEGGVSARRRLRMSVKLDYGRHLNDVDEKWQQVLPSSMAALVLSPILKPGGLTEPQLL